MAKTESTAVNALIELMQTSTPIKPNPADDIMFRAPPKAEATAPAPARAKKPSSPPRMTGTIPPVNAAGEVAPLPQDRSARGTSSVPVRVSTAAPSRGSIPSLGAQTATPPRPPTMPPQGTPAPQLVSPKAAVAMRATGSSATPVKKTLPPLPRPSSPPALPLVAPLAAAPVAVPFGAPVAAQAVSVPMPSASSSLPQLAPMAIPAASYTSPSSATLPRSTTSRPAIEMTSAQPWFDSHESEELALVDRSNVVSTVDGTMPVARQAGRLTVAKLALPAVGVIVVGALIGGFIAFNGDGGRSHTASAGTKAAPVQQVAAVQPAAPNAVAPATPAVAQVADPVAVAAPAAVATPVEPTPAVAGPVEPTPAVAAPVEPVAPAVVAAAPAVVVAPAVPTTTPAALVDVRIDSKPAGATIMLIDRGKTQFLGTTPISTAVDPSRSYDIVFALDSRPTHVEHLDPATSHHLAIDLDHLTGAAPVAAVAKPAPAVVAKPAPVVARPAAPVVAAHHQVAAAKPAPSVDAVVEKPAAPVAASGSGTLMVAAKPPCEIFIDGKDTGMVTPQRAMSLSAGAHKITLVGASDKSIKKTVVVTIAADKPTKLIQDLMTP